MHSKFSAMMCKNMELCPIILLQPTFRMEFTERELQPQHSWIA